MAHKGRWRSLPWLHRPYEKSSSATRRTTTYKQATRQEPETMERLRCAGAWRCADTSQRKMDKRNARQHNEPGHSQSNCVHTPRGSRDVTPTKPETSRGMPKHHTTYA